MWPAEAWLVLDYIWAAKQYYRHIRYLWLLIHCSSIIALTTCLWWSDARILESIVWETLLVKKRLPRSCSTWADSRVVFDLGDIAIAAIALIVRFELLIWTWWLPLLDHPLIKEVLLLQVLRHLTVILLIIDTAFIGWVLLSPRYSHYKIWNFPTYLRVLAWLPRIGFSGLRQEPALVAVWVHHIPL